jgi:hypothetical protein
VAQNDTNLDALHRATSKRVRYLRQRASITGMGNETFEDATVNLARIQAIFKRAIGNKLEEGQVYSEYKGYRALDTSNRYFTPRDDRSDNDSVPLGIEVDPHGFLLQAAGGAYVHTTENKVYYYEKGMSKDGEASYVKKREFIT